MTEPTKSKPSNSPRKKKSAENSRPPRRAASEPKRNGSWARSSVSEKKTLTVAFPLPELRIHTYPLGNQVSAAQRQSAAAELLQYAAGHRIVKLPSIAGYECLYLANGLLRLLRLYDPIHDEITERLDLGYILVAEQEAQATIQ